MSNISRRIGQAFASLALSLVACAVPRTALAQHITVDGRLSPAQTLVGPNYAIGANLGRQVGGNLFHSFGLFGLGSNETASFSGPATVKNIVGRVTGGAASSIDGTIQSSIAGANLFLINPSGIVFGPSGRVSVSGSFHASTADYLRMADGAKFQATNPDASTLSAAAPAAFGFLNASPGAITVNGSQLTVNSGQTLALVGGPVSIVGGTNLPTLKAPSGTIHVASAAGAGEVPVDPTDASALTVAGLGQVSITGLGYLDVSDLTLFLAGDPGKTPGGSIFIRAGTLAITGGTLDATNYGAGPGGRISVYGAAQIALSDRAKIVAPATGAGSGADIILATGPGGSITASGIGTLVDIGSVIATHGRVLRSVPTGASGALSVSTGTLTLTGGAIFGSDINGSGDAGPISISAGSILIDGRAPPSSASVTGIRSLIDIGTASAADMTIDAGALTILANGEIVTNTFGAGNAGRVSVAVAGPLTIDAAGATFSTGIASVVSPLATGSAGEVTITAGSLSIVGNRSPLSSSADVPIPFAGVSSQTLGSGSGGEVALDIGGSFVISDGGVISSSTSAGGRGGTLDVMSQGPLTISGQGTAITAAALAGSTGDAGTVSVSASQITIEGGAQISSSTAGPGKGGDVAVNAAGDIVLLGPGPQITALSSGSGDAGAVMVSAFNLTERGGAAISTEAATANGGDISLAVRDFLYLVDSQITTSVHGSIGNGGNIAIDPQLMVLDSSQIIAQAVLGHGGNITIFATNFFPSTNSLISATSSLGISGTVEIIGPRVDLDGSLVVLPGELKNAAAVFRNSCAALGNRPRSSLVDAGRGGLPQDPEAMLLAVHLADRDFAPGPHKAGGAQLSAGPKLTAVRVKLHCS